MPMITAVEMANQKDLDPSKFRKALRKHKAGGEFTWHSHNDRWTVCIDSDRYTEMKRVLDEISE
jgi:hypothetical protein